jgi:hypothetical protein
MDLELEVTYFDAEQGSFGVEFDGSDPSAPFSGAYTRSPNVVTMTNSRIWKNARFTLPAARLANSQNGHADLRLVAMAGQLFVRDVFLRRK